jgi:hypothetical protein
MRERQMAKSATSKQVEKVSSPETARSSNALFPPSGPPVGGREDC